MNKELVVRQEAVCGPKWQKVYMERGSVWSSSGSVLGPIRFLIFINDIDDEARNFDLLQKFSDNTKLAHGIHSKANSDELQANLNQLSIWAERQGMAFNVNKCKVMYVGMGNSRYQ